MFCPRCKKKYKWMLLTCPDCDVPLIHEEETLRREEAPSAPEYVNFVNLYSPKNETELSLIRSILDSEEISYFVRNDNFGSLEVGPHIGLYNAKMIQVQDDQYEKAKELLSDYIEKTSVPIEDTFKGYSLFDKIRMAIEFFIFGWVMPGKIKHKAKDDEDANTD